MKGLNILRGRVSVKKAEIFFILSIIFGALSIYGCGGGSGHTPPATPTNVSVIAVSPEQINISWDAATDKDVVAGYKIYIAGGGRNSTQDVKDTTFSDTGLSPGTTYSYQVAAYDPSGSLSAPSPVKSAKTFVLSTIDSSGDVGQSNSVITDAAGNVHIVYQDSTNKSLKYATNASGSWVASTIDPTGVGVDTSIALDSLGNLHVIYFYYYTDGSGNGVLKYATNASGDWVVSIIDGTGDGRYSSIAVDSNNHAHVSYFHGDTITLSNGVLTYATNASGAWINTTVDSAGVVGLYTSIAVDSASNAHISYYDFSNQDLKYATNTSGAWVASTVDNAGDVGLYTSIALDSAGKAHISYYDKTNSDLKYATNRGGAWAASTVDSAGDVGLYTTIDIDSSDKAHITYFDQSNDDLKYAAETASGGWAIGSMDSAGTVGQFSSVHIDSISVAYISYYDATNGNLKYATNQ